LFRKLIFITLLFADITPCMTITSRVDGHCELASILLDLITHALKSAFSGNSTRLYYCYLVHFMVFANRNNAVYCVLCTYRGRFATRGGNCICIYVCIGAINVYSTTNWMKTASKLKFKFIIVIFDNNIYSCHIRTCQNHFIFSKNAVT
jgi:hypothetical protein